MRGWLFAVFLLTLLTTVVLTAVGLLANWGIWISSAYVKAGEDLPFLNKLVVAVLVGVTSLLLELGRRWFIARDAKNQIADAYVRIAAAAVVLPTASQKESDINFTYVSDYIDASIKVESEELRLVIVEGVREAIQEMMRIRYGGASKPQLVSEVAE